MEMENNSRGKRKSPCANIIFELSDNDVSSEHADSDCEPEAKILITDFSIDASFNTTNITDDSLLVKDDPDVPLVEPEVSTCVDNGVTDKSEEGIIDSCEENSRNGEVEVIVPSKDEMDITSKTSNDSCICITFSDSIMADVYKFKFLKYLESFVELELVNETDLSVTVRRDTTLDPREWIVLDETLCTTVLKDMLEEKLASPLLETPRKRLTKKQRQKKAKKDKELFVLDTNPSHNISDLNSMKYMSKFEINNKQDKDEEKEVVVSTSANKCFNCDGDHSIRDCVLPRDHNKINAARNKFRAQKQTSRYHLEQDHKYSHLIPGTISDNLRTALGLSKDDIPMHVYKMRVYNYPPGWLEEAKSVYSNLSMFGTDGKTVSKQDKLKKQFLIPEKIVEYPGFNVPVEKRVKDQYRMYGVPPFSKEFNSKSAMIAYFEEQFAREQDDFTICDMEVDFTLVESGENVDVVKENTNDNMNPQLSNIQEVDVDTPSPSLNDLEKVKETLLAALDDSNSVNTTIKYEDTSEVEENKLLPLQIDVSTTQALTTDDLSPPVSQTVNSVMTSSFGTPILKSNSPYTHVPNSDNFMKDVSPVINFENLPNATGKYEQMTEVLQKVRSTLKHCKS